VKRPPKVLIVEDEALSAAALEVALAELGFIVLAVAATEYEALEALKRNIPDVALVDIELRPDHYSDGKQAGLRIAEELWACHRIPTVFATAHTDSASIEAMALTGAFAVIQKPYTMSQIEAQLRLTLKSVSVSTTD
jgi:CheY-like chemotaxis protein